MYGDPQPLLLGKEVILKGGGTDPNFSSRQIVESFNGVKADGSTLGSPLFRLKSNAMSFLYATPNAKGLEIYYFSWSFEVQFPVRTRDKVHPDQPLWCPIGSALNFFNPTDDEGNILWIGGVPLIRTPPEHGIHKYYTGFLCFPIMHPSLNVMSWWVAYSPEYLSYLPDTSIAQRMLYMGGNPAVNPDTEFTLSPVSYTIDEASGVPSGYKYLWRYLPPGWVELSPSPEELYSPSGLPCSTYVLPVYLFLDARV